MTPQEQVKMLREVLEAGLRTEPGWRADAGRALAATAPPKPYRLSDDLGSFVGLDSEGRLDEWVVADLTEAQRFAIVDALNALAEKENAR